MCANNCNDINVSYRRISFQIVISKLYGIIAITEFFILSKTSFKVSEIISDALC